MGRKKVVAEREQLYWHILNTDFSGKPRLGYDDGRVPQKGVRLRHLRKGRETRAMVRLCNQGMHASDKLLVCTEYAPNGTVIARVRLGGTIVDGYDKSTAEYRTIVEWTTPQAGERILRQFTHWCAARVLHLWVYAPDAVRQYLEGDWSNELLRIRASELLQTTSVDSKQASAWLSYMTARRATGDRVAAAATMENAKNAINYNTPVAERWGIESPGGKFQAEAEAYLVSLVEAEFARQKAEGVV